MNLWLQIMFVFFVLGVSLKSQSSANSLVVPDGVFKGSVLDKYKLEQALADEVEEVSKVYDLVMFESVFDFMYNKKEFNISFTAETTSGVVHENIQCAVYFNPTFYRMDLNNCANDEVVFGPQWIRIHLNTSNRNIFIEVVMPSIKKEREPYRTSLPPKL